MNGTASAGRSRLHAAGRTPVLLLIAGGLLVGIALVYMTDGVGDSITYILFIPILIAAARFGAIGGALSGIVAGLLIGPLVPADLARAVVQSTADWNVRLMFFTFLGAFAGWQFDRLARQRLESERALRTDTGTGLANQSALEQDLESLLPQAVEPQGEAGLTRDVSLMFLRLTDLFEALEAVGHDAGDEIVRAVAAHLRKQVPWIEQIYRFTNAELAILYSFHDRGDADAHMVERAEELSVVAQRPVSVRNVAIRLESVIGMAAARADDLDHEYRLIRRAQLALRTAQSRERRHVVYDDSLDAKQAEGFLLVARVEEALANGRFELHYQPKIRLEDDHVEGFEALIRWTEADGSMVPPATFIPRLERTSLVEPIERFVARSAIDFAARRNGWTVAINISPRNLHDTRFVSELLDSLDRRRVAPERVQVEITGTGLLRDSTAVDENIRKLHAAGVEVHVDDFGNDRTSLSFLYRVPAMGIKIDESLVRGIEHDERAVALIKSMADAGSRMNFRVTATGVETAAQLARLREIGCTHAQGYHLGEPMREADLEAWLASRQD